MGATKNNKQIKQQLATATCALLGAINTAQAGEFEGWDIDTAVLHYSEADGRVQAIEPTIKIRREFGENKSADLKITLDALTGATPNGATPTNTPQTFTRPSGNDSYQVAPGEIPLDDTFHDTRVAVNGVWQQPIGRLNLISIGGNFSREFDFLSYGGSLMFARELFEKNTTVSIGVSSEFDKIDPVGGAPIPFASMAAAGAVQPKTKAQETKDVMDLLLGVTQVINRRTLTQLNYSYSRSNGYLNDPYKLLSVIDPVTGATNDYIYEKRPDTRTKHSIYWLTKYHLRRDVISGSYRYFMDDWGVKSHTVDVNYHWKFAAKHFLEPRFRFYQQSEADFYRTNLITGNPLPQEASADYRLADFNGYTVGLKYGWKLRDESLITIRLEYYSQVGDSSPSEAIGVQKGLDLYPDLKATILQVQYSF